MARYSCIYPRPTLCRAVHTYQTANLILQCSQFRRVFEDFFFGLVKIFRNRGTVLDSNNLQDQAINRALALQTFIHVPSVKTVTNLI